MSLPAAARSEPAPRPRPTFGLAVTGDEPASVILARARALDGGDAIQRLWVADERFRRDVWVMLGLLAGATERLELATCVTDPFIRHPALTATAIATLDEASRGRALLGLGAGASGFGALGIERRAPATALRESIVLARRLWDERLPFSYQGSSVHFQQGRLGFDAARRVPIHLAARGQRILALAGELADGVLVATFVRGPLLARSLARVQAGLERRSADAGPFERGSWVYVSIDDDEDAARDAVRTGIAVALWGSRSVLSELSIPLPRPLDALMASRAYSLDPEVIAEAAALVPDDLVDDCSVTGSPETCARRMLDLVSTGSGHIACWLFPTPAVDQASMVDRLVTKVIPAVVGASEGRPPISPATQVTQGGHDAT